MKLSELGEVFYLMDKKKDCLISYLWALFTLQNYQKRVGDLNPTDLPMTRNEVCGEAICFGRLCWKYLKERCLHFLISVWSSQHRTHLVSNLDQNAIKNILHTRKTFCCERFCLKEFTIDAISVGLVLASRLPSLSVLFCFFYVACSLASRSNWYFCPPHATSPPVNVVFTVSPPYDKA